MTTKSQRLKCSCTFPLKKKKKHSHPSHTPTVSPTSQLNKHIHSILYIQAYTQSYNSTLHSNSKTKLTCQEKINVFSKMFPLKI